MSYDIYDSVSYSGSDRGGVSRIMSVSLYRWTEKCDGRPCAGDCDLCKEIEQDGYITWEGFVDERVSDTQTVLSSIPTSAGKPTTHH